MSQKESVELQSESPEKDDGKVIIFRYIIYFLLIVVTAFTLLGRPHLLNEIRLGEMASWWVFVGPTAFGILLFTFIGGEFFVRKGRFSAVPIAFGLLLLAFLLPESIREYRTRKSSTLKTKDFFADLLASPDARVRALVMMASSCCGDLSADAVSMLRIGLDDKDPMVQEAAKHMLAQRIGSQFSDGEEGKAEALSVLNSLYEASVVGAK